MTGVAWKGGPGGVTGTGGTGNSAESVGWVGGIGGGGRNVCKYSSSAWVNLCVMATNGLSPEIGWGSGEWMNIAGTVRGLATGYGSLNVDGSCICNGMRSVSNLE